MTLLPDDFFRHEDTFFDYRKNIYEVSSETLKTNFIDLSLFESYIRSRQAAAINAPAVIDFQYHLKNERGNYGASINRKIFTLHTYGNFLRLYDFQTSEHLPGTAISPSLPRSSTPVLRCRSSAILSRAILRPSKSSFMFLVLFELC